MVRRFGAGLLACTCSVDAREGIGLLPEALAGQEAVLEGSAGHLLEVEVAEVVLEGCPDVLVREVDARYTFVVR